MHRRALAPMVFPDAVPIRGTHVALQIDHATFSSRITSTLVVLSAKAGITTCPLSALCQRATYGLVNAET